MYRLSSDAIDKLIVACNKFIESSSDKVTKREYHDIISKLKQYKEQNC